MKRKRKLLTAALVAVGIAMVCYPFFASKYNARHQSLVTAEYRSAVTDGDAQDQRKAAEAYNESLTQGIADEKEYDDLLGTVMAAIRIPAIGVDMPIYHGVGNQAMTLGAGHMPDSSLPIGGESTHCVISSHSGLASYRGFTDLPELRPGDIFYVDVLGKTLTYEVTEIRTVLPHEVDTVRIVPGKDLFSLVTCVPLFVNSHRLVVTGSRVPDGAPEPTGTAHQAERDDPMEGNGGTKAFVGVTAGVAVAAIPAVVIWRKRK